ncbi:MAG: L,D-transpeptidase family protein [Thermoleophilia bacterium]
MAWTAGLVAAVAAAVPSVVVAQEPPATTAPVAPPPVALPDGVVAPGVSIAGVPVGGLASADARRAVITQFIGPRRAPLVVTFNKRNLVVEPVKVGYSADVDYAVQAALLYGRSRPVPAEGVTVPLKQKVNRARLLATLKLRAAKYDVKAVDAALSFRGATPVVRKARHGLGIDVTRAVPKVEAAIFARDQPSYALPTMRLLASRTSIGPVIVIQRSSYRLTLYRGAKRVRAFPVAVGTSSHPTPSGTYSIIQKQMNPTWFPPDSPWAAGLGPVPPGVSNPLGTRWMGTSAPAIGIHGTPVPSSVGTAASHGCIRMYIHDAEWLYSHIAIGTPVRIV